MCAAILALVQICTVPRAVQVDDYIVRAAAAFPPTFIVFVCFVEGSMPFINVIQHGKNGSKGKAHCPQQRVLILVGSTGSKRKQCHSTWEEFKQGLLLFEY